jgi:trigger factor
MQVTLEKTSALEGLIKVEVAENDYLPKVNKELKEIGRTRQIPGFRPGHVSLEQLRRRFGKEVKSHVLNEEVFNAVINYLRENKVDILGEPLPVKVEEINLDDKDYTFSYEVALAPEFDVDLNKDMHVPFYNIEVSQEMVDQQDTALRERFGAQVPGETVEGKALVKGAIMQLDAEGNVRSDEEAIQVVDGIVAPMFFKNEAEVEKFNGKKVGDKVVFNPWDTCNGNAAELASMLHTNKEKVADLHDNFEMAISEIIVVKPAEHNEEFYKEVFAGSEVTDEETYFAELRKMIATQLQPNSDMMFNRDVQDEIVKKFGNFDLPAGVLKKWLVARNEGLNAENVEAEYEKMVPGIKWELIQGKIARNQDIKVTEDDVLSFAKGLAFQQFAQYGMTNMDDETLTTYAKRILENKEYGRRIREDVANRKLFNVIKAMVSLDEKTVSLDEFKKLANPDEA